MKCKVCGKDHKASDFHPPHLVEQLKDSGFPTHDRHYLTAHNKANKAEKKKFPEGYEELKKLERRHGVLAKHELLGKNTKSGKIEVSKKVPPHLRKEVAFHEKTENKILRKKK